MQVRRGSSASTRRQACRRQAWRAHERASERASSLARWLAGEPGFSWKQLWRRRPQRDAAGHQAPAGSPSPGAGRESSVRAAGLPAWMLEQGGLPCGGELVFGGIFFTEEPSLSVAPVRAGE